jgi:RimJ/RimL family protein N-acetyltransferase
MAHCSSQTMIPPTITVIQNVSLRPVFEQDRDLLFEWRNLPEIVNLSSSGLKVSRRQHDNWFNTALNQPHYHLFIILENDIPIGHIRFESREYNEAEVSVYLLTGKSGRGIGVAVIQAACRLIFKQTSIATISAHIRTENTNSVAAFAKSGFAQDRKGATKLDHIRMVLRK